MIESVTIQRSIASRDGPTATRNGGIQTRPFMGIDCCLLRVGDSACSASLSCGACDLKRVQYVPAMLLAIVVVIVGAFTTRVQHGTVAHTREHPARGLVDRRGLQAR